MAVLKSTNVQGALCVNGVAVGGGKDFKYCCFTASTTFTPSQDLVDGNGIVDAVLVGGGGPGGGASICCSSVATSMGTVVGAGGGGATAIRKSFPITATTGCAVTVGSGGTGALLFNIDTVCTGGTLGSATSFGGDTVGGGAPGNSNLTNGAVYTGRSYNGGGCAGYGGGGMVREVERLSRINATSWTISPNTYCNSAEFCVGMRKPSTCKCACKKALITQGVNPQKVHWEATCCAHFNYNTAQSATSPAAGNDLQEGWNVEKGIDSWEDGTRYAGTLYNSCDFGPGYVTGSTTSDGTGRNCWYASWRGEGGVCSFGKLSTGNGTCKVWEDTHKGFGGVGSQVGICMCYPRNNCTGCAWVDGMSGNDGIVVIKWFE